jgi:hypothetical protein
VPVVRAGSPYGDPAADDSLTGDVADGLIPPRNRMHEYIRARTAFFDRVVVSSIYPMTLHRGGYPDGS